MRLFIAGVVSLLLAGAAFGSVELTRDGQPLADIVVDADALSSVKVAAGDLQKHIELMSGAKLPVVTAPTQGVENHVYVGASKYTRALGVTVDDLKPEGFRIVVKDTHVVLIGRDEQYPVFPFTRNTVKEWQEFAGEKYTVPFTYPINHELEFSPYDATGTLYATSEFLEQLGVRWYHPYENGTVIPEKKTIVAADQDLKKEPVFPIRRTTYYVTMYRDAAGVLWFKRLKYGCSYVVYIGHATQFIIEDPEQRKAHPEYYAMVNGKFAGGRIGVPRLSEPGFRKTSLKFLDKLLEAYPYFKSVNLAPTDGLGHIDERDAKIWDHRDKRGHRGRFSDYVWDYWLYAAREFKKSHPDVMFRFNSYTPYADPPSQVDTLPDNVALCIAQNTATSFLPEGKWWIEQRKQWLPMLTSKKLFLADYYLFYRSPQYPRYPVFFTKHLQEDMQSLVGVGEGKMIETSPERGFYENGRWRLTCPGLMHMLHYWQGKLYWDPDMDREAMLDEYYDLYFGPAKAEMKEFYEFGEEAWMRPESRNILGGRGFLKPEDTERYFDILARARRNAGKDTVYDKRIAEIETEMQPLKKMVSGMKRTGPSFQGMTKQSGAPAQIDGDLEKEFWSKNLRFRVRGGGSWPWYSMVDQVTGEARKENGTKVSFRLTPDGSNLVVGVACRESMMDRLHARTTEADEKSIFDDDVVEVVIQTPERSYFRIAVNPNGAIWDETHDVTLVTRDTLPTLWNPGTQAAVKKEKDRWTVEIAIPIKDFGSLGPTRAYPWGVNVCRTRRASGEPEYSAISPTGTTSGAVLSKLANLWARN